MVRRKTARQANTGAGRRHWAQRRSIILRPSFSQTMANRAEILTPMGEGARRRITRRVMPYLFTLYVIAFLDRVNVSYARLQMDREPWFTDQVFGLGSGIFFIGYFLLEIPGGVIAEK